MKKLAIIPARGGSKRIPLKNIKPFFGQPMISYSIRAAQKSGLFDRIIVSTDDEKVAEVARTYGADTPFMRPADLADDYAGTDDVVRHALNALGAQGDIYDAACCIYATAPLLDAERLMEGWNRLQMPGKRFAFSVTSFAFPIQRALKLTPDGAVEMFWPENRLTRSQDLEEAYHDAAQFYWGWREAWLDAEILFSQVSAPVILPRAQVVDIDTPEDWEMAERAYAALNVLTRP